MNVLEAAREASVRIKLKFLQSLPFPMPGIKVCKHAFL